MLKLVRVEANYAVVHVLVTEHRCDGFKSCSWSGNFALRGLRFCVFFIFVVCRYTLQLLSESEIVNKSQCVF